MWLGKLTRLDITPLGWLGRETSTQTNKLTIANSFLLNKAMKISMVINMQMPTIVGIFIFISRENLMLSWAELEKSFIASEPDQLDVTDCLIRVSIVWHPLGPLSKAKGCLCNTFCGHQCLCGQKLHHLHKSQFLSNYEGCSKWIAYCPLTLYPRGAR